MSLFYKYKIYTEEFGNYSPNMSVNQFPQPMYISSQYNCENDVSIGLDKNTHVW